MEEKNERTAEQSPETMLNLGAWLGRHQAFGLMANRCSAADAECLKTIREAGEYKQLGMTWEQFCSCHAGVSRAHADRLIRCLEEFGSNYFRLAEVMPISPATYRLIAGAVSDEGLESNGEVIPLDRENRGRLAAAVESVRSERPKSKPMDAAQWKKRFRVLMDDAIAVAQEPGGRGPIVQALRNGCVQLEGLTERLAQR